MEARHLGHVNDLLSALASTSMKARFFCSQRNFEQHFGGDTPSVMSLNLNGVVPTPVSPACHLLSSASRSGPAISAKKCSSVTPLGGCLYAAYPMDRFQDDPKISTIFAFAERLTPGLANRHTPLSRSPTLVLLASDSPGTSTSCPRNLVQESPKFNSVF